MAIGCIPSIGAMRSSWSERSFTYALMMKSLVSSMLRMTSLGPMFSSFSFD